MNKNKLQELINKYPDLKTRYMENYINYVGKRELEGYDDDKFMLFCGMNITVQCDKKTQQYISDRMRELSITYEIKVGKHSELKTV